MINELLPAHGEPAANASPPLGFDTTRACVRKLPESLFGKKPAPALGAAPRRIYAGALTRR